MNLFILFLILSILTHTIRTIYEILKIKKKIKPGNKILFRIIFGNMIILWISWFGLCITATDNFIRNPAFKYPGAGIFITGVIIFLISFIKIKRFENDKKELVTTGIYKYFRHPMYIGFCFWMLGSSLFCQSGIALSLAVIYSVNIYYWKKSEEIHLLKLYPEYNEYMKKTYF